MLFFFHMGRRDANRSPFFQPLPPYRYELHERLPLALDPSARTFDIVHLSLARGGLLGGKGGFGAMLRSMVGGVGVPSNPETGLQVEEKALVWRLPTTQQHAPICPTNPTRTKTGQGRRREEDDGLRRLPRPLRPPAPVCGWVGVGVCV